MRELVKKTGSLVLGVGALSLVLANAAMTHGCSPSQATPQANTPSDKAAENPEVALECMHEGEKGRDSIAAPCSGVCTSFRIVPRRCEGGSWRKLEPIEPACACVPESVPASLRDCTASSVVLTPTDEGASDGVQLKLTCGKTLMDVECDGENDGTGTSLCSCHRDGEELRIPGDPWPGEGIAVAYRVAERCLQHR